MKLETKFIGEIEISESQIIDFPNGIPAFEDETKFAIISYDEETPFFIMQSIKTLEVSFLIADPFPFFSDYKVKLPEPTIEQLEIEKEEDVVIFVILTVQEPFSKTTANLQAPVIINTKKRLGKQLVMPDSGYQTKHYIMPQQTSSKEEVR